MSNQLIIDLPVKPISWNACSMPVYKQRRITKTMKYRNFLTYVTGYLEENYLQEIDFFARNFNKQMIIDAEYKFYVPKDAVINKDGSIKKSKNDIENFCKPLTDSMFKYYMEKINPDMDDSKIFNLSASKIISNDFSILIKYTSYNFS